MLIRNIPAHSLAAIVAELVRQGVAFTAQPQDLDAKEYEIRFTGGILKW